MSNILDKMNTMLKIAGTAILIAVMVLVLIGLVLLAVIVINAAIESIRESRKDKKDE